tara:strand:+ start:435 stop:1631 length:1197 start_codon:yes stop_codon:yes gene_type:complete
MATTKVIPGVLDLNESTSESGLKMPSGTELNRPTAAAGQIRNNTNESSAASSSAQEYYSGSAWTKINNVPLPPEFKAKIYTGNANLQSVSGYGFRPDLIWIKSTDLTYSHFIFNSQIFTLHQGIYYAYQYLQSNNNNAGAEDSALTIITGAAKLQSFNSDGFSVAVSNDTNQNNIGYFGWGWKVNAGNTSSNTNGSVTSTVQANDDLGISIVEFTGTGATNTIGHGLSSAPELILIKSTSVAGDWQVYAEPIGATKKLILNLNSAESTTTRFNNTSATSTVFSFNDSGIGTNSDFVAYCFKSVNGNCKIGTYSGTGSSNPITGLGFSPTWVMIKSTTSAEDWAIFDTARGADKFILANTSATNQSFSGFSFDSDGFTVPGTSGMTNGSGQTYLYMAFR